MCLPSAAHGMQAVASVNPWQEHLGCVLLWAKSRGTKVLGKPGSLVPLFPTALAGFEEAADR